jgi:hypothetical protein
VPLLSFASSVLTTAIQRWVGIDPGVFQPSEFTSMIENAGRVGPTNWAARMRRAGTEQTEVAAVELLNLLRPTVAVARFVTFAASESTPRPPSASTLRSDTRSTWSRSSRPPRSSPVRWSGWSRLAQKSLKTRGFELALEHREC